MSRLPRTIRSARGVGRGLRPAPPRPLPVAVLGGRRPAAASGGGGGPGPDPGPGEPALLLDFDAATLEPRSSGAVALAAASTQYLSVAASASISLGADEAFWVAGWVRLASKPVNACAIAAQSNTADNNRSWRLIYDATTGQGGTADRIKFNVSGTGTFNGANTVSADTFGSPPTGEWIHVVAYHDPVNDRVGICVDGGAWDTIAYGGGTFGSSAPLSFGVYFGSGTPVDPLDGRLDEWAFGKAPPGGIAAVVDDIRDTLYNGGAGIGHDGVDGARASGWGLVSWWPFDGGSVALGADAHGTNHLTPANAPTRVSPGKIRATRRGWNGERCGRAGDEWAGEGPLGPAFASFPDRYLTDADGPGLTRPGSAPLLGRSFDLFAQVDRLVDEGACVFLRCDLDDGSYALWGQDEGGLDYYTVAGPGGSDPATVTASVPRYGRAAVVSGTSAEGQERAVCTLVLDGDLDLDVGDYLNISGCGAPFDGEDRWVRSYDPATRTLTFAADDNEDAGDAATPGGVVLPTGAYIESAVAWPGTKWQRRGAALRITRDGDAVRFAERHHDLGGDTADGLPSGEPDGAGAATTIGLRDGDDGTPPARLPRRVRVHGGVLDDEAAVDAHLLWACVEVAGADDFAGMPAHFSLDLAPGIRRNEMHLARFVHVDVDDATGLVVDGLDHFGAREGVSEGVYNAQFYGEPTQSGATTYTRHLAVFPPTWEPDGTAVAPALRCLAPVATIVRRPWPRVLHLDGSGGDDGDDGLSPGSAIKTLGEARGRLLPGTLYLLSGDDFGRLELDGDQGPALFAAADPEDMPTLSKTTGHQCVYLHDGARHVGLRHVRLSYSEKVDGEDGLKAIENGYSIGCSAYGCVDALGPDDKGVPFYSWAIGHFAWHGLDCEPSTTPGGWAAFIFAAGRKVSLKYWQHDRPIQDGSHAVRTAAQCHFECAGFTHNPGVADFNDSGFTNRYGTRAAVWRDCDFGTNVLSVDTPGPPTEVDHRPLASRLTFDRIDTHRVHVKATAGVRFTRVSSITDQFWASDDVNANSLDLQAPAPASAVAEGCLVGGSGSVDLGAVVGRASPSAGPRRNVPTTSGATGEPLTAPGLLDLTTGVAPAGWLVVAFDGLPQGGTGTKVATLVIDGTPVPGLNCPGCFAWPASPGEHTVRVDVADRRGAGTTAEGTPITVTVG